MLHLLLAALSSGTYVGVDLGNGTFKASITQAGKGPTMLINPQSKRSTPTGLMLQSPPRLVGSPAGSMAGKYPYELVELAHSVAGEECVGSSILWDREFHPFKIKCDEKTNRWQLFLRDDKLVLFPEEIIAHYLNYINILALEHIREHSSSDQVANAAIKKLEFKLTLPVNSSYRKYLAMINAGHIAGVKVNPIVVSQTAAAAAYHSTDVPLEEGGEMTKLIVDVGARYAQACRVKFVKPKAKGMSLGIRTFVEQCEVAEGISGGLQADWAIGHHVIDKFENKNGRIKGIKRDKALRRVLTAANKSKHVLSANKAHFIKIENLDGNGNHVEMELTRDTLEGLLEAEGLFERIETLISKFELDGVEALEWIGNGWRIPAIQDRLQKKFPDLAFQTTINADESPSLGALYLAASDTKYKTPKVTMEDFSNKNDLMGLNERQIKEGNTHMAQISREDENRAALDKARNDFEEFLYKSAQLLRDEEKVNSIIEEEKLEIATRKEPEKDEKKDGGIIDKVFGWAGKKEGEKTDSAQTTQDEGEEEEEDFYGLKDTEFTTTTTTTKVSEPIELRVPKALQVIDDATAWLEKTEGQAFDKSKGIKFRDEIRDYMEPLTNRLKARKAKAAEERKKKQLDKAAAKEAAKKEAADAKRAEEAAAHAEAAKEDMDSPGETADSDSPEDNQEL